MLIAPAIPEDIAAEVLRSDLQRFRDNPELRIFTRALVAGEHPKFLEPDGTTVVRVHHVADGLRLRQFITEPAEAAA